MTTQINDTLTNTKISDTKQILNYNTIIIIILIFIFSSKIWNSIWEIGKSLVYAIIIIYLLHFMNPNIMQKIKKMFINYLTPDSDITNGIFKSIFSKLASSLFNIISPTKIMPNDVITNVNNFLDTNNNSLSNNNSSSNNDITTAPTQNIDLAIAPTPNRDFNAAPTQNRDLIAAPTENRNLTAALTQNRSLAPIKATPIKATPIKATPIKATPIKATPIKATPINKRK
jgi:hypothetical protein